MALGTLTVSGLVIYTLVTKLNLDWREGLFVMPKKDIYKPLHKNSLHSVMKQDSKQSYPKFDVELFF